ncbi:MAG: hypothetical protein ACRD50_07585 [Candidatus Acidiferrales bacterium]
MQTTERAAWTGESWREKETSLQHLAACGSLMSVMRALAGHLALLLFFSGALSLACELNCDLASGASVENRAEPVASGDSCHSTIPAEHPAQSQLPRRDCGAHPHSALHMIFSARELKISPVQSSPAIVVSFPLRESNVIFSHRDLPFQAQAILPSAGNFPSVLRI